MHVIHRSHSFLVLVLSGLVFWISGCEGDEYVEISDTDAGFTEEDATGTTDIQCNPSRECGAGVCGTIEDGCGGTLECTPCEECTANPEPCGGCDLGLTTCGPGTTTSCALPDIPGWNGTDCTGLVFVSPAGSDDNDGSKSSPVQTIPKAIDLAAATDGKAVIIAGTVGVQYEGPIHLTQPISLIGGYSVEDFARKAANRPTIESTNEGLAILDVNDAILIENLEIKTHDATEAGANNYAIRIVNSPNVLLKNVQAIAGKGGDGANGAKGTAGAKGGDGGDAEIAGGSDDQRAAIRKPGVGGENTNCATPGGKGGTGEFSDLDGTTMATAGQSVPGGIGGAPGIQAREQRAGKNGEDGIAVISSGTSGEGGRTSGEISTGFWISLGDGKAGDAGLPGSGGGGGGGGATCSGSTVYECSHPHSIPAYGALGGGGGAGGCGGTGGTGGKSGGSSFGLFAVDSEITAENSTFSSSPGGRGGKGGDGGAGGDGGLGGNPSAQWAEYCEVNGQQDECYGTFTAPFFGGKGGTGSAGANGGPGGGGAGGSSFGAYCERSTITRVQTVQFVSGDGGPGGAGGTGGHSGDTGLSVKNFQCD